MSSIAVVILNYNGKAHLEKFLPGVIRYSSEAKVVVVDNGSSDNSIEYVKQLRVTVVDNGKNLGFCEGYNHALKKIEADYYVILNNDIEVTENWIAPLQKLLDTKPEIAAVQPKILSYKNKNMFEYAGAGGGFVDSFGYPFCRGRIFDTLEEDKGQYNDSVPVFWATGACVVVRSKLFHELGGFDEDFFAHMEEIDLCWRMKKAGHKIYYCGQSHIYHVGGGTLAVGNPKKTFYNFRNGLELMIKHMPLWKVPVRVVLDWIAAARFLFTSPADALAVIKAHFAVLFRIGRTFNKRVAGRAVSEVYPGLLIWQYFVKGRKTYKELQKLRTDRTDQ